MNEVLTNGSRPSPPPLVSSSGKGVNPLLLLPNASTDSEIRCFCGYEQDDGFTIQCETCQKWQHAICVKIQPKNVPEIFVCYYCEPRDLQISEIERAKDIQRKQLEGDGRKPPPPPPQPKRSAGTSHRKRETNGHARTHSESISQRLQSPKEVAVAKPRGRQRPISTQPHTSLPDTSASPDEHSPTGKSPSIEREMTSDIEVPPSVYTKEYSPIQDNTFVSPEVDHKIKTWAHDAKENGRPTILTSDSSSPCTPRRYSKAEFHELIPSGHTVRWVSSPEEVSSLGLPLIRLVADSPSKADQFVIEYVGEIGSKTSYIQDTLNQYQRIRHPKAFVLFHPQLPIYIDARRCGSEARFVRRSCHPNLKFETMVVNGTDLRFALYTSKAIDRGVELTIGWEWDSTLPFSKLLEEGAIDEIEPENFQRMKAWADVVTSAVGDCACADREACLMARLKGEVPVGKPKKAAKTGTKRRWIQTQDSTPNGREVSPDKQDSEKYKRRSSSTSSHRKSESRDRTPTFPSADISQSSVITDRNPSARELRKVQETINLIERLTNQDTAHNRKRIKRPSAGPPNAQLPLTNGNTDFLEKPRPSSENTTPAPTSSSQTAVPDAIKSNQSSPKMSNGASPVRVSPKASYVDGGVQTGTEIPRVATGTLMPTSRKMRILAQFRAQNQQREKPPKADLTMVQEESPAKEIKQEADQDVTMTDLDPSAQASPPVHAEVVDLKPLNTGLQDLSKPDLTNGDHISEVAANGFRSSSPQAQISSAAMFPTAPTTPAPQAPQKATLPVPSTSSPLSPLLPQIPTLAIPPVTAVINPPLPTPPLRKQSKPMSLSDYTRRNRVSSETTKEKPVPIPTKAQLVSGDMEKDITNSVPIASNHAMDLDPIATDMGGAKS